MSLSIVNTINLDYSIIKEFSTDYNKTVDFYTGSMFPDNKTLQYAVWDFGDGSTLTVNFSSLSAEHRNAVIEVGQKYNGFFPRWRENVSEIVGLVIPKFYTSHTYANNGNYNVNVTIVDSYGTGFVSQPKTITVNEQPQKYTIPSNWTDISNSYSLTNDSSLFFASFTNSLPPAELQGVVTSSESVFTTNYIQLSTITGEISSLPIDANFILCNATGRLDIDYIEWNFGDGTVHVNPVLGAQVIDAYTKISYRYPLISNGLSFSPYVMLYIKKGSQRVKIKIPGRDIILQNRTNLSVSKALTEDPLTDSYAFNIEPTDVLSLPVDTKFTIKISPELKYILWDFNDGTYDVIPVKYIPEKNNVIQTKEITHSYSTVNYFRYVPECIFLYQRPNKTFYSVKYQSRYYLNYNTALLNPNNNFFITPTTSTSSYSKFDNIHISAEYGDDQSGTAKLKLRVSLDIPSKIYYFEKLIWTVNGKEIIQNKNTSKNFGYLEIDGFAVPSSADVSVDIFGIPAIYAADANNYELSYYDTFAYKKDILSKADQQRLDKENLDKITQAAEATPEVEAPFIIDGEIITPLIEISSTEAVEGTFPTVSGVAYSFDRLFQATKPVANFLNRDYPSTVSTPSELYATKRDIGYFRPSKTTNIIVEPGKFKFIVNFDKLAYDDPLYFPDPYKYGSSTDVLSFNIDETSFKKKSSFSIARDEPNTTEQFITFYGYSSELIKKKYNDLSYIYDEGYIHDIKKDVFGNSYGLIKNNSSFDENVNINSVTLIPNVVEEQSTIIFNGYEFFDSYFGAGSAFNYFLTGGDGFETVIPGLSTFTNGLTGISNPYTLKFGTFTSNNYKVLSYPVDITTTYLNPIEIGYRDGSVFMINDSVFVADPISSDVSTFPGLCSYYFNELFEAGAQTASPYVRPLSTAALSADFTQNVRLSGDNGVIDADCGLFVSNIPSENNLFGAGTLSLSGVNPAANTQYSSTIIERKNLVERNNLGGAIYIKDSTDNVSRLTDALSYTLNKYGSSVYSEISSTVKQFELVYNTYFIQTSSNLVIDRIIYEDNTYKTPRTPNVIIPYNRSNFNPISNRFKIKDNVYFATLTSVTSNQSVAVLPLIYKFNLNDFKLTQIYSNIGSVSAEYVVNSDGIEYVEASTPVITYNDDNNKFNLSYIIKDQNKSPYLISIVFTDRDNVVVNSITGFRFGSGINTQVFSPSFTYSSFSPIISSSTPVLSTYSIIL